MKNLLITLMLLTGLAISTTAQTYGIKGGYSLSNLSTDNGDIEKENARHGISVGVFANYPIGIFSIQPELLFTQKGSDYKDFAVDIKSKLDYIELPISLQLNLLNPLYIYAGPQFSYLIRSKTEYSFGGAGVIIDNDESKSERVDVGAVVGLGYKFNKVFVDARFSKGYINYDKERTVDGVEYEIKNLQNFNFQLTAGLLF